MKINLLPYPANADSRHAKASSLLAAGDSSVDVFAVNDEMINAFKNEGPSTLTALLAARKAVALHSAADLCPALTGPSVLLLKQRHKRIACG